MDAPKPHLPGGKNKVYLFGGLAGAGVLYWAYQRRKNSALPATTVDPSELDTLDTSTTDDGYSPATGNAQGVSQSTVNYGASVITTNPQWEQDVIPKMEAYGYDTQTVSTALGHYLGGVSSVTQNELDIIQAAIGLDGYPPTPVPVPSVAVTGQTASATPSQAQARAQNSTVNHAWLVYQNELSHYTAAAKAKNPAAAQYQKSTQAAQAAYESAYNAYVAGLRH